MAPMWIALVLAAAPAVTDEQLEADWLRQDAVRAGPGSVVTGRRVRPAEDAIGATDGVKDGKWAFHTGQDVNPWWQVDLGETRALGHLLVYNRCDIPQRAGRLMVLLSDDAKRFREVYQHNGTRFYGYTDKKPLRVGLAGQRARYVRLQLPGKAFLHLDEVEVYGPGAQRNIALGRPATQSSTSRWSVRHEPAPATQRRVYSTGQAIERGLKLADHLRTLGVAVGGHVAALRRLEARLRETPKSAPDATRRRLYLDARRAVRRLALANPLLDFDTILFVKRAPTQFPHMSDQYYGWWSRPGGGVYVLEGFKGRSARVRCLTADLPAGNVVRPELSYDGRRVLFAYCRYHPDVARQQKLDKTKLPEDCFYHIYEMNVDGSGRRRLTRGRYDDFDARYLPNGEIVFLSTRKGAFLQTGKASARATCRATLPDSFVRCGGGAVRPVSVYTLHVMAADGSDLRAISAFENFEWTPAVADDGRVLYARWDYIDRPNGSYISLWSTNTDGTNPQLVYGNFTTRPQCLFEARPVPGSRKLVFTGSAHHSVTGGSLGLLDRTRGTEGPAPVTRLTPEVCFPEIEGWPASYYANPWPLSETFFLVAWSDRPLPPHTRRVDHRNPANALGVYLYDAFGNLELLHRDPAISSQNPIPVRPRRRPPAQPASVAWDGAQQGRLLLQDVYDGLEGVAPGRVRRLRIVGVVPKTGPTMNRPVLGVSREDPGKFVLGSVPVEPDGSAHFRVPSGVPLFFQVTDADGLAVQTMRTLTYVQPGQTLSCIGCHEHRDRAPARSRVPLAARREPSRIAPGPPGTWPLRFDRLVQPVLDRQCVRCHNPASANAKAAKVDLTAAKAWKTLIAACGQDLKRVAYERSRSRPGQCPAGQSKVLAMLRRAGGHHGVRLADPDVRRLAAWIDTYAHIQGAFDPKQEQQLTTLRRRLAATLLTE